MGFPGSRFLRNVPFDDVDLDIEFNGGDVMLGFFDMKVNYKFVQKYVWFADLPQEGYFEMYRNWKEGCGRLRPLWTTIIELPDPSLIYPWSLTKVQGEFVYNDNKWEFKLERVPGHSIP